MDKEKKKITSREQFKKLPWWLKIIVGILVIIGGFILLSNVLVGTLFSLQGISTDSTNQTNEWAMIETRRGDLNVLLPRNPVYEIDQTPDAIESYVYTATDNDDTVYIVKYENIAKVSAEVATETGTRLVNWPDKQKRDFLKAWADSNMEELNVDNLSSEYITVKGYPAIQYIGKIFDDRESINLKGVLMLIDETIYSFVVLYENNANEQLDRVINSASFNHLGL